MTLPPRSSMLYPSPSQNIAHSHHGVQMSLTKLNPVTTESIIWIITRLVSRDVIVFPIHSEIITQAIPYWSGFHCLLSEKMPDVTDVAYPPIINAKPTDMSTVLRAMTTCLDMSNYAGQEHAIQAFDQQLYAISQQVKWSRSGIFEPHILRLDCFHSLSTFFRIN